MGLRDIAWVDSLPPFRLFADIIRCLSRSDNKLMSISELAQTIEQEPSITAKLIAVANSPYYAPNRAITNVSSAIMLMGLSSTKSYLLSTIMKERFRSKCYRFDHVRYWFDTMMVARLAPAIAKRTESAQHRDDADYLYTLGLLHSIGVLLLVNQFPDEMEKMLMNVHINDAIAEVFGMDYYEISARLLKHWGVPQELTTPIFHLSQDSASMRESHLLMLSKKSLDIFMYNHLCDDQQLSELFQSPEFLDELHSIHEEVIDSIRLLH